MNEREFSVVKCDKAGVRDAMLGGTEEERPFCGGTLRRRRRCTLGMRGRAAAASTGLRSCQRATMSFIEHHNHNINSHNNKITNLLNFLLILRLLITFIN